MSRWGEPLCGVCGNTMQYLNSRWTDRESGSREVAWRCNGCDDDYVEAVASFDVRANSSGQWVAAPALGLQALVFDVEGWPVKTSAGAELQHRCPGSGEWYVVTSEGELLDQAPLVHGGPLDRLITGLINQRLAALRSGAPDSDTRGEGIALGNAAPDLQWKWATHGHREHRLHLTLDGWPLGVEQHLTAIKGEPRPGGNNGHHDWYVITPEKAYLERVEGMPKGSIGEVVTKLCQERLAQLRRWDEMRRRKKRCR